MVLRVEGDGPKGHGKTWGLGPGRLPWALSGEDGDPLEAERGRGLGWEEEVGGVRSCLGVKGTCFLLFCCLLTFL